jgi:hypothetical protein
MVNMFILEKNGNIGYSTGLVGSRCHKNRLALSLGGETALAITDRSLECNSTFIDFAVECQGFVTAFGTSSLSH